MLRGSAERTVEVVMILCGLVPRAAPLTLHVVIVCIQILISAATLSSFVTKKFVYWTFTVGIVLHIYNTV